MTLHQPLRRLLPIAALLLLTSVVLNELLQLDAVSAETAVRLMGLMRGSIVLVLANALPKRLVPLARLSCDPARDQTLRRLSGQVMVLGGLGYTLAYALAPIEIAGTLAICLLMPASLIFAGIMARCAWARHSARRSGV